MPMIKVLDQRSRLLKGFDKQWSVEESFWIGMEGEVGLAVLHKQVLDSSVQS